MPTRTEELLAKAQSLHDNLITSATMLAEFTKRLREIISQLPPEEPDDATE